MRPPPSSASLRRNARPWLPSAADGAWAGLRATTVMSGVMLGSKGAGLMGKLPPTKITQKVLDALGIRRSKRMDLALSLSAHVGYGMLAGAVFSSFVRGRFSKKHPVTEGIAFGMLVWVASYFGWVPALGLMAPPPRDRPGRPTALMAAHCVFGAALGRWTPYQSVW